jgi:hypothetical protein
MSGREGIQWRYSEIKRLTALGRTDVERALAHAWHAGRCLVAERDRVQQTMGRSAWNEWLRLNFPDTPEIARRYMRLASEHASPATLSGLSLREVYFRLGVSTEPKVRDETRVRCRLAGHVRSSQRLLLAVHRSRRRWSADEADRQRLCRDLEPLYRELNTLFSKPPTLESSIPERPLRHE